MTRLLGALIVLVALAACGGGDSTFPTSATGNWSYPDEDPITSEYY